MKYSHIICIAVCLGITQAQVDWHKRAVNSIPKVAKLSNRIIGGIIANQGEVPYHAAVISDARVFCGGALISETIVLTAAHCINTRSSYEIHLGADYVYNYNEPGHVIMTSYDALMHPDFNISINFFHDIAFVRLPKPARGEYIKTVNLPRRSQLSEMFEYKNARTSGWGTIDDLLPYLSERLRYVDVEVVTEAQCQADHGSNVITSCQICASTNFGTEGLCSGDAGAPLTYIDESDGERTLIGIGNWGNPFGCEKNEANVYIRVTCYAEWIEQESGITLRP